MSSYVPTYLCTYLHMYRPTMYLPTNFNLLINLYHMFNYLCLASANYQFIYHSIIYVYLPILPTNLHLPTYPPYQPTPTYLSSLATYTYIPMSSYIKTPTHLGQPTYINIIPTYDYLLTYVNQPTPTNLHQHTYLPVSTYQHLPSSTYLPLYIIAADPGASIGLV